MNIAIHGISAIIGLISGSILFFQKRHTYTHYIWYIWRISMYLTALSWLTIYSDGISWLHIFSWITIFFITRWIYFWCQKKRLKHNVDMLWTYIWLFIAFLFTLLPWRRLWDMIYTLLDIPLESQIHVFYIILSLGAIYSIFLFKKFFFQIKEIKKLKMS